MSSRPGSPPPGPARTTAPTARRPARTRAAGRRRPRLAAGTRSRLAARRVRRTRARALAPPRPAGPRGPTRACRARRARGRRAAPPRGGRTSCSPSPVTSTVRVMTASSSRRTRTDASHSPAAPSTGHSGSWIPLARLARLASPRHRTCSTSSCAQAASVLSPSRASSDAVSRGHQTRASSSPSGSPPSAYRRAARSRLAGSSARNRPVTVSRPAAARSASLTSQSPLGTRSPCSSRSQTASRSRPGPAAALIPRTLDRRGRRDSRAAALVPSGPAPAVMTRRDARSG